MPVPPWSFWVNVDDWAVRADAPFSNDSLYKACIAEKWNWSTQLSFIVTGIVVPVAIRLENFCIPADLSQRFVIDALELWGESEVHMANWLLLSTNTLTTELVNTENRIVSRIGTVSGTNGGGVIEEGAVEEILEQLRLIKINQNSIGTLIRTNTDITRDTLRGMETDLTLDHDEIINAILSLDTIGSSDLIDGIGSLLGGVVDTVTGIISTFENIVGEIMSIVDVAIIAVEARLKGTMTGLVDSVNLAMSFFTSEIDTIMGLTLDAILDPLNALGDIADFLFDEFFDFLKESLSLTQEDMEEGALTFLNAFRKVTESFVKNVSFVGGG